MYEKQNFVKGQILKAEDLNRIEDGIVKIEDGIVKNEKAVIELTPIISTTDITAGSAAPNGRPYHVIE